MAEGPSYSREDKSLEVLCTDFLTLYNCDGVDSVVVKDATTKLGVAPKRLYVIVYSLESMEVMVKKARGQYTWNGFGELSERLIALKNKGMEEGFHTFLSDVSNQREHIWPDKCSEPDEGDSLENKKFPSRVVTKNFVKLFLCSDVISLPHAALALVGDGHNETTKRKKVRKRLTESSSVLLSMGLLQKIDDSKSQNQSFKWIGMVGICKNGSSTSPDMKHSKRAFGTEKHSKDKTENAKDGPSTEQHQKYGLEDFAFGHSTPNDTISAGHENREGSQIIQDLDRLFRAYQTQFSNPAIGELINHYVEAWNQFYDEAKDQQQIKH